MDLREEMKSAGVYPIGAVSAWPRERHQRLMESLGAPRKKEIQASAGKMAKGLLRTAGQAIRNGKVTSEVREERYATCKACPLFDPQSKRCTDCGCFMEAKTWVGGDPDLLCPQQKWSR